MRNKKILALMIGSLLVLLVSASTLAAAPLFKKAPSIVEDAVIWELTKTTVVDAGQTYTDGMGTFTQGYTLEAKAKAKGNNVVPEGSFWLTLNAFSPANDIPGQKLKTGLWYVQGTWRITKKDADPEALKVRHNSEVIEGSFMAELEFNPAADQSNWTGVARLPMALAAGQWGRGEGTLTFDKNLEGDLYLPLEIWSKSK